MSRKDSQIKHQGHRIELGEIEAAVSSNDSIHRACCVYDHERKKIFVYYIGDIEAMPLIKYLKDLLPRYMIPSVCIKLDTMPLTSNGKLDRKLLQSMAAEYEI